jgi:hypothetical protein
MAYWLIDDAKGKHEGMTKEQIINAIAEATGNTPQSIDAGFISTILETNHNNSTHLWMGNASEYAALETHDPNTLYIVTNDTTLADMEADIDNVEAVIGALQTIVSGLDSSVTQLDSDVSGIDTRMTDAEADIEAAEADIDALEADTGWLDVERTYNSNTSVIGKYRVIGKIAYFDFDYNVASFHPSTSRTDSFTLPIKLDVSGKANGIYAIYPVTGAFDVATVSLTNSDDETTVSIDAGSQRSMSTCAFSFSYPIAAAEEEAAES